MAATIASRSARGTNSPAATSEPDFLPRAELTAPRLAELAALDDAAFRALFAGTAVKRTGRDRFVRNVLIAIGNAPQPGPDLVAVGATASTMPRRWCAARRYGPSAGSPPPRTSKRSKTLTATKPTPRSATNGAG